MAENLHSQFDYLPLFLPTQPQVMRYVWKKVKPDNVEILALGGELRVHRGANGPFKLQRLHVGHKTHVLKRGKRRDHTNLIFLKKGDIQP